MATSDYGHPFTLACPSGLSLLSAGVTPAQGSPGWLFEVHPSRYGNLITVRPNGNSATFDIEAVDVPTVYMYGIAATMFCQ
jgi:hypothetical protein